MLMQQQSDYMRDEMKATQDAALAAKVSAATAIETAEQMRLDQRAWLCLDHPQSDQFVGGQVMKWWLEIKNTGTTPATIIREIAILHINQPGMETLDDRMNNLEEEMSRWPLVERMITPGFTSVFSATSNDPLDPRGLSAINTGVFTAYLVVRIDYIDAFKCDRYTLG
jgi:hypothetical protein